MGCAAYGRIMAQIVQGCLKCQDYISSPGRTSCIPPQPSITSLCHPAHQSRNGIAQTASDFPSTEGKKEKKIHYPLLYHVFPRLFLLGCLHDLRPEDEHLLLAHLQLLVGRFQLVQKKAVAVLHVVGGVVLRGVVCDGLPQLIELIFQLLVLRLQLLPLENTEPLSSLDELPCGVSSCSEMPLG